MSARIKLVANVKEIIESLAPFYTGKIHFRSDKGDYTCALCASDVKDTDVAAISYGASRYGTWVHVACTKAAKSQIIEDAKAKEEAKRKALKRDQKARKQDRKADVKGNTKAVAELEAKYDALMTQALEAIKTLQLQKAGLQAENDQLRAHLAARDAKVNGKVTA